MRDKNIIYAARVLSILFTPFYLPILGLAVLFAFSYMGRMPFGFIAMVFLMVYGFTILLPTLLIRLFSLYQGWSSIELSKRERRIVPYIISIFCYFTCYYVMGMLGIPGFIGMIVVAALFIQIICSIVNIWWKISTHSAAIGGVTGAIMAFALLFQFNPLEWLALSFFVAGLVGTSRMILRQHSLAQIVAGFWVGMVTAFIVII